MQRKPNAGLDSFVLGCADKCYIGYLGEQVKADKQSVRACFQSDDSFPRTPTYHQKETSNSLVSKLLLPVGNFVKSRNQ